MQVSEICGKLQRGDKARIARVVGCANGTVNAVLRGWRNPDTELSKRIIEVSLALIKETAELERKLELQYSQFNTPIHSN